MYGFRKVYIDLVTIDRAVLIAYLTETSFLGSCVPRAMIELYWPDGRRESYRAPASSGCRTSLNDGASGRVWFELDDGRVNLEIHPINRLPASTPAPIEKGLWWTLLAGKANVTVKWSNRPGRTNWKGSGYMEEVRIDRFFRRLAIREVDWGRIHFERGSVVFNSVMFENGARWQRVHTWIDSAAESTMNRLHFTYTDHGLRLQFEKGAIALTPERVLHHGQAIDRERFPNGLERALVGLTSGRLTETRWLSKARGLIEGEPIQGWALHERVFAHSGLSLTPGQESMSVESAPTGLMEALDESSPASEAVTSPLTV